MVIVEPSEERPDWVQVDRDQPVSFEDAERFPFLHIFYVFEFVVDNLGAVVVPRLGQLMD